MKIIKKSKLPTIEELKTLVLSILNIESGWKSFATLKELVLATYPIASHGQILSTLKLMVISDKTLQDDRSPFHADPPKEQTGSLIDYKSEFINASLITPRKDDLKSFMVGVLDNQTDWIDQNDFLAILSENQTVKKLAKTALMMDAYQELLEEDQIEEY